MYASKVKLHPASFEVAATSADNRESLVLPRHLTSRDPLSRTRAMSKLWLLSPRSDG